MKTRVRRRLGIGSAIAACLLAIAGGTFYFTGSYAKWRDGRSLNEACGGVVPKDEVRTALGSAHVRAESDTTRYFPSGEEGRITNCYVEDPDNGKTITVDLHWASKAERVASAIKHEFLTTVGGAAVPMGRGWPGTVVSDEGLYGGVELGCRNKKGESLLVSTFAFDDLLDPENPDEGRGAFARVTSGIAKNAAEKYDCDTQSGDAIKKIAPNPLRNPTPIAQAEGTCSAVAKLDLKRRNLESVTEAPADPTSPAEDCYLNNAKGEPVYRLTALYGSFAKSVRYKSSSFELHNSLGAGEDSGADAKTHRAYRNARCPEGLDTGLYTLSGLSWSTQSEPSLKEPDPAFERAALKAFAQQSAKRHGCTGLQTP
ncbi:hypothetical protein [Streptomyces sp. RTd22]|uniref:hypothetical protein n=1 Tax=Streptomyces sp. RTd22 TaxID=1841249 RepID=UPI0007D8F585|nr:hypothetical protein [Streptomyces sp. RTd22]